MSLLRKLFPKLSELKAAEKRIEELAAERSELLERNRHLWENYNSLKAVKNNLQEELRTTKTKIREQTDADLLLVSARIIAATLNENKPEHADVVLQSNLLAQQQAMGAYRSYNCGGYGYGGLLGLGNVLLGQH